MTQPKGLGSHPQGGQEGRACSQQRKQHLKRSWGSIEPGVVKAIAGGVEKAKGRRMGDELGEVSGRESFRGL